MAEYVVGPGLFPQTSANRTRSKAIDEIGSYVGGAERPDIQNRVGLLWDAAVREFNSTAWIFNRQTQDITLLDNVKDYTLNFDFNIPMAALLVDTAGNTRTGLEWIPYDEWVKIAPWQVARTSVVSIWTARNVHDTGLVTFDPTPVAPFQHPTVRVHYFSRIQFAAGSGDRLDVPVEVDEAIFQKALAQSIANVHTYEVAAVQFALAKDLRIEVEQTHRGYTDF